MSQNFGFRRLAHGGLIGLAQQMYQFNTALTKPRLDSFDHSVGHGKHLNTLMTERDLHLAAISRRCPAKQQTPINE